MFWIGTFAKRLFREPVLSILCGFAPEESTGSTFREGSKDPKVRDDLSHPT